ncbi:MAG: 1-acyl-sn-glycerol-3-phosphate acyltransferase [Flavobacteriia bacterium]|nr:1-acyl-sn-glycerol-3-phosphate acyltransferase [Flavobacteriia bacterium]
MLYRFLKLLVGIGIRFYYKEVKVLNEHELNQVQNEPLIIVANHPNTLMDAMLVGFVCKQQIYFMAKGTLFNSKFKMWILRKFNMIPINRQGDGKVKGVSNQDSFEACYKILEEGKTLVVFPEGTSFLERQLRELKSGTARIALEAEARNKGGLHLKVLPIGLNYLQAEKFRSSVLVNVGLKIEVSTYLEEYQINSGKAAKKLTEKFRMGLERVLVHSESKEHETITDEIAEILSSKYIRTKESGVEGEVQFLKKIRDRIEELELTQPWKLDEIKITIEKIKTELSALNLRPDFLDRRFRFQMFFRQLIFSIGLILIGFPVFIVGLVINVIPYKITDFIVPKLTKDIEYVAPLSVLLGLLLYPLDYGIIYYLTADYFANSVFEKLLYFSVFPISGLMAYSYMRYYIHIKSKWIYVFQMVSNRKKMLEIQEYRLILRKIIWE